MKIDSFFCSVLGIWIWWFTWQVPFSMNKTLCRIIRVKESVLNRHRQRLFQDEQNYIHFTRFSLNECNMWPMEAPRLKASHKWIYGMPTNAPNGVRKFCTGIVESLGYFGLWFRGWALFSCNCCSVSWPIGACRWNCRWRYRGVRTLSIWWNSWCIWWNDLWHHQWNAWLSNW